MTLLARPLLVLVSLASAATALAAEPLGPTGIQPFPAVVQFAKAHSIPHGDFELAGTGEPARPGDRITVLFTIQEGAVARQWLGEFSSATLTDREAKSKPGTGLGILSLFQSSLKTDTGHEYSFAQIPVALEIQTHGPFTSTGSAVDESATTRAHVLATRDYLVHGLAPMAEIELRLRAAGKKNPGLSFMFRPKYSDEQRAATKARARDTGFTETDERAYAEGIYALVQFASLAFRTDGVDAITREIADSPTLFSGAFVNLDWSRLQLEDGGTWGLPDDRIFRVPYNFNSKTQARGSFFVTTSRPPLQNMAGIVGLTVDWTSKASNKRLIVRVLASRRGAP
jgi:hypothetical protein